MHAPRTARRLTARRIGVGVAALALAAAGPVSSATAHTTSSHAAAAKSTAIGKAGNGCSRTTSTDPVPHPGNVVFYQARESLLGLHRWYQQLKGGNPVPGGWWGWHRDSTTDLITIDDCRIKSGKLNTTNPKVRPSAAARTAAKAGAPGRVLSKKLMSLPYKGATRLVWAVTTMNGKGARTSYVDAVNARVLKTTVISHFARSPKFTIGTGRTFDPNPVAKLQDESLRDHQDAADAVPPNGYTTRDLPRLRGEGHTLVGKWAKLINKNRATSDTATYNYNRHNDYFEQVQAYYAIDAEQAYLQGLGFDDVNAESQRIAVDTFADDNSFYIPGIDRIEMGTGGVDDAEDPEVTWHEYGHAIQDDQVPEWGSRYQGSAMGEGFGDYMAVTMSQATSADTATVPSACVMDWDATSYTPGPTHCLRRTDTNKTWSGTPDGDPHADGEIWSAALWDINQELGRDEATTIIIEAHFWMTPKIGFEKAAQTTVDVANEMFGPTDADVVLGAFVSRGLMPPA